MSILLAFPHNGTSRHASDQTGPSGSLQPGLLSSRLGSGHRSGPWEDETRRMGSGLRLPVGLRESASLSCCQAFHTHTGVPHACLAPQHQCGSLKP